MKIQFPILLLLMGLMILGMGCQEPTIDPPKTNPTITNGLDSIENTLGYGVLNQLKGIWNGPVTSSTPLGSYPEWIVDFRPISASQISAKNELDTVNDIHLSFFITKHKGEYRVCFRNGGGFAGLQRVSYFLCDSVSESGSESFYRFSEAVNGRARAFTDVLFKTDSLIISSYTNKYNQQSSTSLHMQWRAKLQDTTSSQAAVDHFGFPQKVLAIDFDSAFVNDSEAIYYNLNDDPYNELQQPYLGQTTINYSFQGFTPDPSKKVLLFMTTQPLISGFSINYANLKYRSRYVFVNADAYSFEFNYMHPGTYYVYALYDNDGDLTFSSGDRTSTTNTSFTLTDQGTATASTVINFIVP